MTHVHPFVAIIYLRILTGANLLDKLRQLTTLNLGHLGMTPQSVPIISSDDNHHWFLSLAMV